MAENYKYLAAIHGVDVGDTDTNTSTDKSTVVPQFGDPATYSHLTAEEKDKLTAEMKSKHKAWAGGIQK
ncbi:MAG: hypothetical protein DRN14_03590 [Thermoplasmata archaeon]|nr:MAG: hypothetical protein DRN14_03590 [Thermoplasmata archaeon]